MIVTDAFGLIVGVAFFLERLMEPILGYWMRNRRPDTKKLIATFGGIILGVLCCLAATELFPSLAALSAPTRAIIGVLAGLLAPYTHDGLKVLARANQSSKPKGTAPA